MADKDAPQIIRSADAHRETAGGNGHASARPLRFLGWLTLLVFTVGLLSLLSYSLAGSELIRSENPAFAAWWHAYQFYFMEGAATALGMLLGIRTLSSAMGGTHQRSHAGLAALVFAIIAFAPLIHVCAAAARLGWNGRGVSFASWIISHEGYERGRQIDKVVIAGVYFLKTAGFALLAGLGLMAIACVAVLALESTETGKT
jgi:hypothetical protein